MKGDAPMIYLFVSIAAALLALQSLYFYTTI